MASVQERLAESLKVLKDYQDHHENLIIKGNNLLALHSLKSEFAGKRKATIGIKN